MTVEQLKEILSMYPPEMEVYVQTNPSDLIQPLTQGAFSQTKAIMDGVSLQQPMLVITAHIPVRP